MDYSVCMYVPPISVIVTEYNISVKLDKTLVQYFFFALNFLPIVKNFIYPSFYLQTHLLSPKIKR